MGICSTKNTTQVGQEKRLCPSNKNQEWITVAKNSSNLTRVVKVFIIFLWLCSHLRPLIVNTLWNKSFSHFFLNKSGKWLPFCDMNYTSEHLNWAQSGASRLPLDELGLQWVKWRNLQAMLWPQHPLHSSDGCEPNYDREESCSWRI